VSKLMPDFKIQILFNVLSLVASIYTTSLTVKKILDSAHKSFHMFRMYVRKTMKFSVHSIS